MAGHPYALDAWIGDRLRNLTEAIEQACEASIQGGEHGVLIVHHPLTQTDAGLTAAATVSVAPGVPYGEIWERWP